MAKKYVRKKSSGNPFIWILLIVVLLAIPITVALSSEQTNFLQFAARKHKNKNNNNRNNNKGQNTAGVNTGIWIPGGTNVVVEDYTNPGIWRNYVQTQTHLWSGLLQGGASLTYVRKPYTPCSELFTDASNGLLFKEARSGNFIIVCSVPSIKKGGSGATRVWTYEGGQKGAIAFAIIELKGVKTGGIDFKKNTICHELGHAVGIEHSSSDTSCVSPGNQWFTHPGLWDRNTLKKSYAGTITPIPTPTEVVQGEIPPPRPPAEIIIEDNF